MLRTVAVVPTPRPLDDVPDEDPGALLDVAAPDLPELFADLAEAGSGPAALVEQLDEAFGADADAEYAAIATDAEEDAEIARLVVRAQATSGRESLSALSALSQQMGGFRPLDPGGQAERLRVYRAGAQASAALARGDGSAAAQRDWQQLVRRGQWAQTELVGSMYRLVLIIARELAAERYGREKALDMLPDLVSEANVAVVEAITTFDEERCPTFSIYAGRVIRDKVRMSLQKSASVGVAPSWLRLKRIYTVLRPEVEMRLGRTPTAPDMQAALRVVCMKWAADRLTAEQQQLGEAARIDLMEQKLKKQGMLGAIDRLAEVLAATQQVSSLDAPVGDDMGTSLGDLLPQQGGTGAFEAVEHAELHSDLMSALRTLTDREQQIMLHRFGFADGEQWTYAKLAPMYGVSPERIRQIERNVLGKLRGPAFGHLGSHLSSRPVEAGPDPVDEAVVVDDVDEPPRRRRPFQR